MLRKLSIISVIFLLVGLSLNLNGCRSDTSQLLKDAGSWELPVVVNNGKAVENETIKMPDYMAENSSKGVLLHFMMGIGGEPENGMLKDYQALYDQYREKGLSIIGICLTIPGKSYERKALFEYILRELQGFTGGEGNRVGLNFPVLLDENNTAKALYSITSFPADILINQDNKIVYEYSSWSEELFEDLDKEIQQLLN